MANETLLDLSTTKPDFESFVGRLQTDLRHRGSWTDVYPEATGETLIHYNSAVGTMDQWAIEKAFKEAFIGTATQDSSIYAGTRMLGVRIARKVPGIQKCYLMRVNKINLPITGALVIPEYKQFYINDSIPFFNRGVLNFVDTSNELNNVQLYQGLVLTKTLVSDGTPFLQIVLPSLSPFSISDVDIQVVVGTDTWTIISDGLWKYGKNSMVVEDATLGSGDVILQFGNGVNGKIPPSGTNITITYVETQGSKQPLIANLSSVNSAFTLNGFVVEGNVVKDNSINLENIGISASKITLSSISDAVIKAYLPVGASWDIACVGLQLNGSPGLGLIVGINGREATLSVVSSFETITLEALAWTLSLPATGQDEKDSTYYKIIAPSLKRAGNRAVTPPDHSAIFMSYPGISDVLVRTEKDLHYKAQIPKSPATILKEQQLGVYTGVDYYEVVKSPHPALYNVIWVSLLRDNGSLLTPSEELELRAWFDSKQFSGSIIRFQSPVITYVNLHLELKCNTQVDPVIVKNKADALIRDIFKPDKRVLSKRVTVSDLHKVLSKGLEGLMDSVEFYSINTVDNSFDILTDAYLIPSEATIAPNGMPIPPGYLSLSQLEINSNLTSR